jgi:hypothetical protein
VRVIDPREQHAGRVCSECGQVLPRPCPEDAPPLRGEKLAPIRRRPECGAILPRTGEPCGRIPGHRDSHRSRWVMDDEARRRRSAGYLGA